MNLHKKRTKNTQQSFSVTSAQNRENHSHRVPVKPTVNWEEPDFDEFDLCMEITAYVNHLQ
ncbi:MAG: pyrroloquinoline quinone precursor peptide PqqA [Calothrix sp. C42_A2020_038]|nr:pyrroloquinoline quinone precursor peptide PqqA [Calothrix sp. C42_A2020_038]